MMKSIFTCAMALCLAGSASAATVNFVESPPITPSATAGGGFDYRIVSVLGVDIDGFEYDATFHYTSFPTPAPDDAITFATGPSAEAAIAALIAEINGVMANVEGTITTVNELTSFFGVPVSYLAPDVTFRGAMIDTTQLSGGDDPLTYIVNPVQSTDDDQSNNDAWVSFNQLTFPPDPPTGDPVPEPASIALFGIGALMLGSVGYRRRRKQRS